MTIRGLHLLGDHSYPIFWPMAWLTGVLPTIPTLLAIQSAALAGGIVPLWWICRRIAGLGLAATAALVISYAAFPALHNVNLADFHPETLAVPFLLGAVLFALTDRWVPYGACLVVVLACREDMALVVTFLGVLLIIEGRRRAGPATMLAGLTWLALTTQVIQPHFAGSFVHVAFLDRYGSSIGEIATAMAVPRLGRLLDRAPAAATWVPAGALVAAAVVGHTVLANDSILERPWSWRIRDQVDEARIAAAELIPAGADVSASDRVWPLIAERRALYNFPGPWRGYPPGDDPVPVDQRRREVEYLFVDTVDGVQWSSGRAAALGELSEELDAQLIFDREGIRLYRLP